MMWTALKEWFTDPATFFGSLAKARGILFALGTMTSTGVLDLGPAGWWLGLAAQISALFMAAGEQNNLRPEEVARIKAELERLKSGAKVAANG